MENSVYFLRLNTGEDIISEIEETETSYVLLNPCKVVYLTSAKPGYLSISLMQWVFSRICEDQNFEISKRDVMFKSFPNINFVEHYHESVEHFAKTETNKKIKFEESFYDNESFDTEDSMNLLEEIFSKIKNQPKGKLN